VMKRAQSVIKTRVEFYGVLWLLLASMTILSTSGIAGEPPVSVGLQSATGQTDISADAAESSLAITDARGKVVKLSALPQRIVVTGKASFMVVDAVYLFPAACSRVVGISKEGQGMDTFLEVIDPGYSGKMVLGREAGPEQIAAAKPDVVLMKSTSAENLGRALESLEIPVVCVDFETPAQYDRDLAILGRLFRQETRARVLGELISTRMARINKALAGLDEKTKPKVLLLYYSSRDGAVACNVPPKSWIQTLLVKMAGGRPIWDGIQLGQGWTKVGFEQIAAWDPDQIFVVSYFVDTAKVMADLLADTRWQGLRAVRAKKFWAFPGDMISWDQPDPRWMLGLTWLASKIHPERFPNVDIANEVTEFFQVFYGVDAATVKKVIAPKLHGDL